MCGIAGYYSPFHKFNKEDLIRMTDSISHRGPDAEGHFCEGSVGLGHRRLSILDLSNAANQPMTSHCNNFVMVYNGEVYNYKEIASELIKINHGLTFKTSSDTEIILEAFVQWGPDFINKLNGMFAIAIYNKISEELFICRDRLGIKPLYYAQTAGELYFASELKSLLQLTQINKNIHYKSIYNYLHLGYIPEPDTIYEGIKKFPAGHYAVGNKNSFKFSPYWQIEDKLAKETFTDFPSAKSTFKNLITSSVKYRMISDVPYGTFLSGGIDSSLITAVAQQLSDKPVKTFSIGFSDSKYNEAAHAKKIASFLGTDHHELYVSYNDAMKLTEAIIDTYDEPFADSSAIPTMLVSQMARKHVTMTLSGDGGDELFMGYGAYRWAKRLSSPITRFLPAEILSHLPFLPNRYKRALMVLTHKGYNLQSHIFSQEQYLFSQYEMKMLMPQHSYSFNPQFNFENIPRKLSSVEKQALFDLKYYLKDDLLVKVDRASMKYSLETRVPLLDYRIVEFAINLNEHLKIKNGNLKYFLKNVLYDYVPEEMVNRPKQGFSIPLSLWLKKELNYLIDDYLNPVVIRKFSIVSFEHVQILIKRFNSGENYLYNRIWTLILLHKFLVKHG